MKTVKALGKKKQKILRLSKDFLHEKHIQNGASLSKHVRSQESPPSASLEGAASACHPSKAAFLCKIRKQKEHKIKR